MSPVDRIREVLNRAEARKGFGNVKNSLKGISWFAVSIVFVFILGVIFFIIGIVNLSSHGDYSDGREPHSPTSGWILFSIGMILIILGLSAFLGRCFCPRPPQRQIRTHVHRHRGGRVSSLNERPPPRSQRIWSTPSPVEASTPVGDRTVRSIAVSERRPSNAPPTYDEAIGRPRQSTINPLDPHPPPYNPETDSIALSSVP